MIVYIFLLFLIFLIFCVFLVRCFFCILPLCDWIALPFGFSRHLDLLTFYAIVNHIEQTCICDHIETISVIVLDSCDCKRLLV
jgi:hypothetical protein